MGVMVGSTEVGFTDLLDSRTCSVEGGLFDVYDYLQSCGGPVCDGDMSPMCHERGCTLRSSVIRQVVFYTSLDSGDLCPSMTSQGVSVVIRYV